MLAEVVLEILPRVGSLTDSLLAQHFHHIGYKVDNHNFVDVGKRDCRISLGMLPHVSLLFFFRGWLLRF